MKNKRIKEAQEAAKKAQKLAKKGKKPVKKQKKSVAAKPIKIVKESSLKTMPLEELDLKIGVTVNDEAIEQDDKSHSNSREKFGTVERKDSTDVEQYGEV